MFLRAAADHQAGRLEAAERGYRQVLAVAPTHADSLHLLGVLAHQAGRSDMAIDLIERAIALQPRAADFYNNLGNILRDIGRAGEACARYRQALRLDPLLADLHHNLGKALFSLEQENDAEAAFRRALQLNPEFFDAQNDLGNLLCDAKRYEEAKVCFDAALRLRPNEPRALNNLGRALIGLRRFDAAETALRTALRVQPDYVKAHYNLGNMFAEQRLWDAAEDCWRTVLRLAPDDAEAHVNLGMLLLLTGRLEQGWPEMDWLRHVRRDNDDALQIGFPPPTWHGEDIGDRTLVLYADQGLGDAIHFARYVPSCAARARVMLAAPPTLGRLFSGVAGVAAFVGSPPFPENYVHCPLTGLPRIFGTTLASIPSQVPYLHAEPADIAVWRDRLSGLQGVRVGLVWAGNPKYPNDRERSMPLEPLARAAQIPGVSLVSLQKGPATQQIATLPAPIAMHDPMDRVSDMADTAALIEALDLVVGVDTSVIHLAGALGKPVWLLNRFDNDWRWLLDRDDSPWYPTLRQFRQDRPGDWSGALAAMRSALTQLA